MNVLIIYGSIPGIINNIEDQSYESNRIVKKIIKKLNKESINTIAIHHKLFKYFNQKEDYIISSYDEFELKLKELTIKSDAIINAMQITDFYIPNNHLNCKNKNDFLNFLQQEIIETPNIDLLIKNWNPEIKHVKIKRAAVEKLDDFQKLIDKYNCDMITLIEDNFLITKLSQTRSNSHIYYSAAHGKFFHDFIAAGAAEGILNFIKGLKNE